MDWGRGWAGSPPEHKQAKWTTWERIPGLPQDISHMAAWVFGCDFYAAHTGTVGLKRNLGNDSSSNKSQASYLPEESDNLWGPHIARHSASPSNLSSALGYKPEPSKGHSENQSWKSWLIKICKVQGILNSAAINYEQQYIQKIILMLEEIKVIFGIIMTNRSCSDGNQCSP